MNTIDFFKKGSGIHIKEKNKGKFTKSAKAAGLSVQEHAKSVLNDPNATPLLKKRANFARNAAKWKHLYGGNLVDTRSDTTRLGYHEGTIPYGASLWNGDFPLIDIYNAIESKSNTIKNNPFVLIGIAPTPGRIKVSNALNKNLPLTKKVNSSIKSTATYVDGDKRHLMSGRNRITQAQRERAREMIGKYYPKSIWGKKVENNLKRYFKLTNDGNLKKLKLEYNSILDDFIENSGFFKEGGIIKALEGTKTSWWRKGLDFLNSDSGKGILNVIGGVVNSSKTADYEQNFDNVTNATVLAMEKKLNAENENLGMLYALLYLDYLNKVNPDQHYGEIDKQRLAKLFAKLLVNEADIDAYKAQRALEKALLMLAIQGSGGIDWLSLGLGLVGSFLGSKKTSSTTNNNSSTLHPYMYTGLGGYLNNPSLA